MGESKHFTVSGDRGYISRIVEEAGLIEGVLKVTQSRSTSAVLEYDPTKTNIGALYKLLHKLRAEKGQPNANP